MFGCAKCFTNILDQLTNNRNLTLRNLFVVRSHRIADVVSPHAEIPKCFRQLKNTILTVLFARDLSSSSLDATRGPCSYRFST